MRHPSSRFSLTAPTGSHAANPISSVAAGQSVSSRPPMS